MIDRELLGKIKDKATDEETGDQKKERSKKGKGCLIFFATSTALFFLLIIMVAIGHKPQNEHQVIPGPGWRYIEPSSFPPIERRTSAGVGIEKGADIDYRVDGDKIIDLSVSRVRRQGYRCNSLSSIKLYRHPERIVVECNGGKDRYRISPSSGHVTRQ